MSGRQRIPPLRVLFVDQRPGQPRDAGVDEARELLTEELPVRVESVLADGDLGAELRAARGHLEVPKRGFFATWWPLLLGIVAVLAAAFGFVFWRRHALVRARVSAYDVAMRRLAALEARGLPGPGEADAWFVELSAIVRRYLEDRFAIRAPELTTEEFLREAGRSHELTAQHQALLSSFLTGADRVKFAGHEPDESETREALAAARRFLAETRLRTGDDADEPAAADGGAA